MISELLGRQLNELRYEPTAKRLRVSLDGQQVADTRRGLLVWEPRRVVPAYAVATEDITARLNPSTGVAPASPPPILDPTIPFQAHTCVGDSYDVVIGGRTVPLAAFRPDDPDLAAHVILEFDAFDWQEEDEPIVAHPHDPFSRIDTLRSDRHIRIELGGRVLAESSRPALLFETHLPVRYYLPREDVAAILTPSNTETYCAYKGRATYFSVPEIPDVAWTYKDPLHDAEPVRDHIAFFNERVDIIVDGERGDRPTTPWST